MSEAESFTAIAGKRLLVTGGFGFLASALVAILAPVECRIVRVTRQSTQPIPSPTGRVTCEHLVGNIREGGFWEHALVDVDFVFHFAAQTSLYTADENPMEDWQSNVLPMLSLLETCRARGWRPGILFAGSATQFGIPSRLPVDESHSDRPVSIYDWHKLLAEGLLEHYVRRGWARGTTLRLANIYGPGPTSGKADRGILNQMLRRALRGEALTLYGTGSQLRDYLFVTDTINAFLAAAAHLDVVNGRHFVLGSGVGHTIAQAFGLVSERAALLTGRNVPVVNVEPPAGLSPVEDRNFVADISQMFDATGWSPQVSLAEGISLTLMAFREAGIPKQ